MSFDWVHFQFPPKVFFEKGSLNQIGTFAKEIGSRVLIVSVKDEIYNPDDLTTIKNSIDQHTTGSILFDDLPEKPNFSDLDTAIHFARQSRADVILGYGSRKSFYAARLIAAMAQNEVFMEDLAQSGQRLKKNPLPLIMVPVAPAMGEEATPVISAFDSESGQIFHMLDDRLFPALIFVDPMSSVALNDNEMTRCGVAILASSIESILTKRSNEITTSVALRSLELIAGNLETLIKEPGNILARSNVAMSSLLSGMAHANSGLGICYSIALSTSHHTGMDFYTAMGILLPHVMDFNLTVSAARYIHIARALDQDIHDITVIEAAIKAVESVRNMYSGLKLPVRLSDFDIRKTDLSIIADLAIRIPFSQNSTRDMDRNELETILISAY